MQSKKTGIQDDIGITTVQIEELEKELCRTGVALETVLKRYNLTELGQMTSAIYEKAKCALANTKTA